MCEGFAAFFLLFLIGFARNENYIKQYLTRKY
jgi:hypothetical protein